MANEKRLKVIDYYAARDAFDEEYKKTRKLIESGETHLDNLAECFTEADMVLRKMLNVDAVEVVRCRDCKRCFKHTTKRNRQHMWICMRNDTDVYVRPDDFCSYGERKDGDGNG